MKKKKGPRLFQSYPEIISIFVAVFIFGLLISSKFSSGLYLLWLSLSIVFLAASFLKISNESPKRDFILLLISALFASMFYGSIRFEPEVDFSDMLALNDSSGTLTGTYTGKSTYSRATDIKYIFNNLTYNVEEQTISIPGEITCITKANRVNLYPEQRYSMSGTLEIPDINKNPIFNITSDITSETELPSALTFAKKIQLKIKHGLTSVLKKEHSGIIIGFILGDTSQITDKALFTETGISHLLAISGQHIMILVLLIASILHWLKIPPISRSILIALFLTFYATITVGSPSVWRALIMYICIAIILHLESSPSPIRPISIAALILLLYDPSLIKNAAFMLSFTAVLSIIFLRSPIEFIFTRIHLPKVIAKYLSVTFAANLGTMPLVAYLFGTVSLSALFVNPLILWTFTFILPTAFFIAFLSVISIPFAVLLSPGLTILLDGLIYFLETVKNIPGLYFYVGNLSGLFIVTVYFALFAVSSAFNRWEIMKLRVVKQLPEPIVKVSEKKFPQTKPPQIHIDNNLKVISSTAKVSNPANTSNEKNKVSKPYSDPFENAEIVAALDEMICSIKKKNINNNQQPEIIPAEILTISEQNLYYRIYNINADDILVNPNRIMEIHILTMAIIGGELLNRISSNLTPPLSPSEIKLKNHVNNRHLAVAILSDKIMNLDLLTRIQNPQMNRVIQKGQTLYISAQSLLDDILNSNDFTQYIEKHFAIRDSLMRWCWEFIEQDNLIRSEKEE